MLEAMISQAAKALMQGHYTDVRILESRTVDRPSRGHSVFCELTME